MTKRNSTSSQVKKAWRMQTESILLQQIAHWKQEHGITGSSLNMTTEQKEVCMRWVRKNYPYQYRSGYAYQIWLELVADLEISLGIRQEESHQYKNFKPRKTKINTPSPGQLTLF